MNQYRVTKYNPVYRNQSGTYLLDEWTDFSDIGKVFSGSVLTAEEYYKVEKNYIKMCIAVWIESAHPELSVRNVEKYSDNIRVPKCIKDEGQLEVIVKEILENELWAKLECRNLFFHFGWDYYMYIGTEIEKAIIEDYAKKNNLFVEEMKSPHLT